MDRSFKNTSKHAFNNSFILLFVILTTFMLIASNCKKDDDDNPFPDVTTVNPTKVYIVSVVCNGNVTADKGYAVTERGFCWSTNSNPSLTDSKITCGAGTGTYSGKITGLTTNTEYHVRAYATNSQGTSYGSDISFTTLGNTMKDYENNVYNIVQIGNQVWMAQNLRTKVSPNSEHTPISYISDNTEWKNLSNTDKAYCWPNNDVNNAATYGALYTYAATIYTSGSVIVFPTKSTKALTPVFRLTQGICPAGWHLPTSAEWDTLSTYLGGEAVAGGKLKETGFLHWNSTNTGATNDYGFTALPGGWRNGDGYFDGLSNFGVWWTSSSEDSNNFYYKYIYSNSNFLGENYREKKFGLSVRCLKD